MKLKKTLIIFFMPVLLFCSISCETLPDNQSVPEAELVNYIMSQIEATPRCEMNPKPAFAESGFSIFIGKKQTPVAFYKYNCERKKMREKLERIKESGYLYLTGVRYKAMVNGCFVMINFDRCPEEDRGKLIRLFENF